MDCYIQSRVTLTLLLTLTVIPTTKTMKIILMYASCDDQLTYLLHLLHRSIKTYINPEKEEHGNSFKNKAVFHGRHNLSDACDWVLQDTIAVVAISSETRHWSGIDSSAHDYNLPHFVSPNLCRCQSYRPLSHSQYIVYLEKAVFEFLKDDFLHDVIILHEDESTDGAILSVLLTEQNVRVSHLRLTERHNVMKMVEHYFEAWNMVDLSDDGRLLISLGGGNMTNDLLKNLVESNMHNKRTKLLILDNPEIWQARLKNVLAYEVDLVVVSQNPVTLDDCPVAVEFLPTGSHSHTAKESCRNLSSEYKTLGASILNDFQGNFSRSCCPPQSEFEVFFTFWASWPNENGTQRLKTEAVWSSSLGLMTLMPIDIQTITLRIVVMPYRPYVLLNKTGDEITLEECVFGEIINFLAERLNFKYRLIQPEDGEWGNRLGPGRWNGAIGMLNRGEADIIPYLASTPTRQEAVDFSIPLAYVKYGMLVAFPSEPPRAFIFLRPYKSEVWFLFIVAAFAVSFALYKMHRWSCEICKPDKKSVKGLSTFFRCVWLIFGAMLNQGGTHLPVTNSARLVLASWWLAVLVIMATFSANLIAFLAFPQARWVVKTLEDLVQHKSMRLIIKEDCPVLEDFRESNFEIYRRIREVFLTNSTRITIIRTKRSQILDPVAESQAVFIDDLNYLNKMVEKDYIANRYCRLTIAPTRFSKMDLALGFRRGSSLLDLVNNEVQQMQESGVLEHWKKRFGDEREECFDFDPMLHSQSEITLEDLQGPFYLLALGCIFGTLFLTSEYVWNEAKNAYRRYMKRRFFQRQSSTSHWKY